MKKKLQENRAFDFKQANRYMYTLIQIQIIQFLQFASETIAPGAGLGSFVFFFFRVLFK